MLVTGTGISIAASINPITKKPHPQASWAGLLESGLAWLEEHNFSSQNVVDAHRTLLQESPRTESFINTAEEVIQWMGGANSVNFKKWIGSTIGTINAYDNKVLSALHALREQGCLLATTNYDGLLVEDGLQPITWLEKNAFIRSFRKKG